MQDAVPEQTAAALLERTALLEVLAEGIEAASASYSGHVQRTGQYARMLADTLSRQGAYVHLVDADFVEIVSRAAKLHDIGKLVTPREILTKPGPLTDAEREEMRLHVAAGATFVERAVLLCGTRSRYLDILKEIVTGHHEWYDGSGYPAGLRGEDIPLAARIVALADVFDALTSTRPYKSPASPDAARTLIEAESGRHFDPEIVSAFRERFAAFAEVATAPRPPSGSGGVAHTDGKA